MKSDEQGFSATFHGVGGSTSTTITSTYQLTGAQGYMQACIGVGNSLLAGCFAAQSKCAVENSCAENEL